MSSCRTTVAASFGFSLAGTELWAHPGHGSTSGQSISHYIVEPVHAALLLLLGVGIASAIAYWIVKRSKRAKVRARKQSP